MRGARLVSPSELKAAVRAYSKSLYSRWYLLGQGTTWQGFMGAFFKAGCTSDIKIAGVPIVKDSEVEHMILVGSSGTGKSTTIKNLLPQIRRRKNKAIIIDIKGEYVSKFYDPSKDFIINPFDTRTKHWSPWAEGSSKHEYEQIAKSLFPTHSKGHTFWDTAARKFICNCNG